jgi:hypothetical protein
MPQTTVWRVVHNRIHLYAYKVQTVDALKPDDKPCRFHFTKDILSNIEAGENYLRRWIFSDVATYDLSGRVSRYNCRIWGSETPTSFEKPKQLLQMQLSGVLCHVRKFLGPFSLRKNSDSDHLPGHATLVSVTPVG